MAVQALLMAGDHAEITDAHIREELFAKETGRIFDKDRIGRVKLGKSLFIFSFDHHLRLCRDSAPAGLDQVFEPKSAGRIIDHDRKTRHRALRMWRRELPTGRAGVLAEIERARAGLRIDVVEVDDLLADARPFDQFQSDVVILIAT